MLQTKIREERRSLDEGIRLRWPGYLLAVSRHARPRRKPARQRTPGAADEGIIFFSHGWLEPYRIYTTGFQNEYFSSRWLACFSGGSSSCSGLSKSWIKAYDLDVRFTVPFSNEIFFFKKVTKEKTRGNTELTLYVSI